MGDVDIAGRQQLLDDALRRFGATMVGFCSIGDLPQELCKRYPVGIAIVLDYDKRAVALLTEDDHSFEREAQTARNRLYRIYGLATQLLKSWGYGSVPLADTIPAETLPNYTSDIPLKTIATRAAVGWVGKSNLLITNRYGPRVRLGAILTDAPFKVAKPVTESKCGDCQLCVIACPVGAIKGNDWNIGVERDEMLDCEACNNWRRESLATLGRKSACAHCMAACPIGVDEGHSLSYIGKGRETQGDLGHDNAFIPLSNHYELSEEELAFFERDDDIFSDINEEPVSILEYVEKAVEADLASDTPQVDTEKVKKKPRPRRRPRPKSQQNQSKEEPVQESSEVLQEQVKPAESRKPRAPRRPPRPKADAVDTESSEND